ncbi:G5 domain-containing protein [Micromonospora costi]|uniref:G5 domain-containing protein n=1 Tax=Micromonospora costi TaxID=1530042 RepID=UPI00340736E5
MLLCCGGLGVIGLVAGDPEQNQSTSPVSAEREPAVAGTPSTAAGEPAGTSPSVDVSSVAPSGVAPSGVAPSGVVPSSSAPSSPTVETRTVTETATIKYGQRTVKDPNLAEGKRVVRTKGVNGVRTLTYRVTVTDGVQTGKKLIKSVVTKQPVTQVVAVGTKPKSTCDPNYSGCVPIASDVDCAGGSGNGPAYVSGPVRVIGSDIYDLDRDGDGYACD